MQAAYPVFVSPDVIWLVEMAKTGSGQGSPPYTPTGAALAYDLQSHHQVRLPFSMDAGAIPSIDIWPH